jgi:flavorubredoxin
MEATNSGQMGKPTVMVFYDMNYISESDFADILLGIEEEGIPYDVHAMQTSDVLELAKEASIHSRIGVGIGVSKEGCVLQYEKLDKEAPVFRIKFYQTNLFRNLGSNAARLVKKMPFKVMD